MKKKSPNSSTHIFTPEHEVDLSKASYSTELSSASMDDETQSFQITIDKILYKHPVEVIETVLRVNGFSLNLENILACLDELKIGATVQLGNNFPGGAHAPKSFIPSVQFRLPQKVTIGPMLKKFYAEIESYESIIAEFKTAPEEKTNYREKEREYREKVLTLGQENQQLQTEIKQLREQLHKTSQAEAAANRALEAKNILPSGVRLAMVREVNIDERMIILKSGPTTIYLPIMMCDIVPYTGDKCLVYIKQNNTLGSFFFDSKGIKIKPQLARVMMVKNSFCKIRTEDRNTWKLEAKNQAEFDVFQRLRKNDYLLLYLLNNQPLRFEELIKPDTPSYSDSIQEAIARFQVDTSIQVDTTERSILQKGK